MAVIDPQFIWVVSDPALANTVLVKNFRYDDDDADLMTCEDVAWCEVYNVRSASVLLLHGMFLSQEPYLYDFVPMELDGGALVYPSGMKPDVYAGRLAVVNNWMREARGDIAVAQQMFVDWLKML